MALPYLVGNNCMPFSHQVYSYLEVNLIRNGSVNFSVMEDVVPTMTSTPDYISVSLSTLPQYTNSPDPVVVASRLHPLLNHVASQLRPKQGGSRPSDRLYPNMTSQEDANRGASVSLAGPPPFSLQGQGRRGGGDARALI